MHLDLKRIYTKAENDSLTESDLKAFNNHVSSLAKRLETYNFLRNNEILIFQPVANQLVKTNSNVEESVLQASLKNWMGILRYSSWAMLINDPDYLEQRLLAWLKDVVKVQAIQSVEKDLYEILNSRLKELLSDEKFALINQFLTMAETALLKSE